MSTKFCIRKTYVVLLLLMAFGGQVLGQSANFNFSASVQTVIGWTNVVGDPGKAVRTAATSSGIGVSSVATANWAQDANGNCAYDGAGEDSAGFFPVGVMGSAWYQYGTTAATVLVVSQPQLIVTGLKPDSVYTLRISGSFLAGGGLMLDPVLYTVMGTVNYGTRLSNDNYDITDGAVFKNVVPDSTGSLRIYLNTGGGSNVAALSGLQVIAGQATVARLSAGAGLGQYGSTLALGDSITGLGPHSFVSNRYQYLNGNQYSIGGSVKDAANHPVLRFYDNGDLAASTTMTQSVSTDAQTGLRFYSKLGILQIGATDRLDTAVSIPSGTSPGGGILMNSKTATGNTNILKATLMDSYIAGNTYDLDSTATLNRVILNGQNSVLKNGTFSNSVLSGYGINCQASVSNSLISGGSLSLTKPVSGANITGYVNTGSDTSYYSLVSGGLNHFGGMYQTVSGSYLTNRTPGGVTFGNSNVDFSTLAWTGLQGYNASGLAGYPLFVIGNSSANTGTFQSNAVTVLYNGRTQINTTGFSAGLTQTQVTPQAALDVVSTNTGVLLPRLTTSQRNAIVTGDLVNGLLLYNTDSSAFQYYNGSVWNSVGAGGASSRWMYSGGAVYDSVDNIGIGTSNTQGYKLAVNGAAIFTRMVVKPQSAWPDYVFDKNYRLRSLADLEKYIQAHHHLPEVASQEEVQKEGVDVSAQQGALLKKVEELTLYVIDLDKQVNRLEQEHNWLKAHASGNQGKKPTKK